MPGYLIERINYSAPPASGNQFVSVFHKLISAPDSSYVTDGSHIEVYPNGVLVTPFEITGLAYGTEYTVKVSNDYEERYDTINISMPPAPSPGVTGFAGTTLQYNAIVIFNINAAAFGTFNGPVQNNNLQVTASSTVY